MKKRNLVLAALLTGSLLATGVIVNAGEHGYRHDGDGFRYMMREIDLNQEQRDTVKALMDDQRDKMQENKDEMRNIRKQLRELARDEKYDATKVRELADKQAAMMSDMIVQRTEMMHRMRTVLDDEQLAELEEMQGRFFEHRRHGDDD